MRTQWRDFTFGFEIEGLFTPSCKSRCGSFGSFGGDGSVRREAIAGKYDLSDTLVTDYEEYRSKVFTSPDDLLNVVEKFEEGRSHFWDFSCGLHLHVQDHAGSFIGQIVDWRSYKVLYDLATTKMCACQRRRLKSNNSYCKPFESEKKMIESVFAHNKYHFFHVNDGYDTVEFRFLSACEHKKDNLVIFFTELERLLFTKTKKRTIVADHRLKYSEEFKKGEKKVTGNEIVIL